MNNDHDEFPERAVLAEGYPWAVGTGPYYYEIRMDKNNLAGSGVVALRFPEELWRADLPRYRLVLERIDDDAIR